MKIKDSYLITTGRNALKAFIILLAGIVMTIAASLFTRHDAVRVSENEFQATCSDVRGKIFDRLNAQAQFLRCGSAFFEASDSVSRNDWRDFYNKSSIDKNLPGIQGFGYSVIIKRENLDDHILRFRKEGFPDYSVLPRDIRDNYTSIIYIEPFEGRNLRAFGFDMYSEPIRRKAMEISRDSNIVMLSGKVTLVQETNEDVQAGSIMYVPVYLHNRPVTTAEERRAAILGWVYCPFRMNDLIDGVLGHWDLQPKGRIRLQIYDEDNTSHEALLFDSQRNDTLNNRENRSYIIPIDYHGKKWTLLFTKAANEDPLILSRVLIVFISGLIISFLLFILSLSLFNTRYRAQQIAERLSAEIKQAAMRLSLATRASGVGIWVFDLVSNNLIWDDQMFKLYGITSGTFSSAYEAWIKCLHPDDAAFGHEQIQMAIRGEKEFNTEFRVCWPDGSVHNLRGIAALQRDETGKPLQMIGTNWDITVQKKTEEALIIAKQEADSANKAKSEFLVNISHEFRTPLNAILGYSEFLASKISDASLRDNIESIKSSGITLLTLVNDFLYLIKLEKGNINLELNYIETLSFFSEFEKIYSFKLAEKGLGFKTDILPETPSLLLLDGVRLRQIIMNLIGNAIKFTETGEVVLRVYAENYRRTKSDQLADIVIEVKDTGIGIPEDYQSKIFEAFSQVGKKTVLSGTGLGLTITYRLVESMNGSVKVISHPGEGSTFIVKVPGTKCRHEKEKAAPGTDLDTESIIFHKAVILVADDREDQRRYIRETFKGTGLTVLEANDGLGALTILKETTPDLFIVDLQVSGLDGNELLSRIKSDQRLKHIPVIAYVASSIKEPDYELIKKGFAGVLRKPLRLDDLFTILMGNLGYDVRETTKNSLFSYDDLNKSEILDLAGLISSLEGTLLEASRTFEVRQPIGEVRKFGQDLAETGRKHNCGFITRYGEELIMAANSFNVEEILRLTRRYHEKISALKQ